MEKTEQQQINETIGECLENLRDALKIGSESRDVIMKLLQFEGNRIDTLENKIDLLMTERAEVIALRSEIKKDRAYTEYPVTEEEAYEEKFPKQLEKIHFNDYHFEVARWDKSKELTWHEAMNEGYAGDWRLPTIDELRLMYLSKERLGMKDMEYWSSSENRHNYAWSVYFGNGTTYDGNKDYSLRVRLVRTIEDE